jgi:MipA family protein
MTMNDPRPHERRIPLLTTPGLSTVWIVWSLLSSADASAQSQASLAAVSSGAAQVDPLPAVQGDGSKPANAFRYVFGAAVSAVPEYPGSQRHVLKLRPLWAVQYGRFRISTSRAGAVLGFDSDAPSPGASAELIRSDQWKAAFSLRMDSGRNSRDSPNLAGMPDIKPTLRGRLGASYALGSRWSLASYLSQDLLGRRGGALWGIDFGYGDHLGETVRWSVSAGLGAATGQYLRTHFGVTQAQSGSTGLAAYAPVAGLRDVHVGIGITAAVTPRWIAFGSINAVRLVGGAAGSPLTRQSSSLGIGIGIAYRCCAW